MEYCPVLLKMGPQIKKQIKKFYPELDTTNDYKYVLQVWNSSSEKVYEKILINPIKYWSIWHKYFIFEMETGDKDSEYIHMIQLEKENSLIKIEKYMRDPANYKFFAYHKDLFYIASHNEIQIFYLKDDFELGGTIEIDPNRGPIARISSLNAEIIHGLFSKSQDDEFIYVALETHDHQVDFNRLSCKRLEQGQSPENFQYKFSQEVEVVQRTMKKLNDNIKDFQFVFINNTGSNKEVKPYFSNAVALRESGSVDFYSDMALASTFEYNKDFKIPVNQEDQQKNKDIVDYSKPAQQIGLSFDETYVGYGPVKEAKDLIRKMKNSSRGQISIESSEIMDDLNFKNVFFSRIQNHCKVFSYYVFVKTFIFVAHSNILSLFDVQKLKWKDDNHLVFEDTILQVFRSQNRDGDSDICVMLKNGKIQVIVQQENNYTIDYGLTLKIQGEFVQHDQDRDDNRFTFIMSELDDGQIMLYCYYLRQLIPIQDQFEDESLDPPFNLSHDTNFVFIFAEADETRFLIQEKEFIRIYTIEAEEVELNEDDDDYEKRNGEVNIIINKYWSSPKIEYTPAIVEQAKKKSNFPLFGEFHSAISIINRDDKVKYKDYPKDVLDKEAQQYFFLFDDHHIYIFYKKPIEGRPYVVFYEEEVKGVFFSDNNYLYTLSYKRPEKGIPSSFRLYDIWNCISTNSTLSYELSQVQVGCQALIDFSLKNQRFLYQSSFNNLEVVPVLHRNSIYFMGMLERNTFLSTRVIDDRFIALDSTNHLTTWSTVNGKVRFEWDLKETPACSNIDLSGYKIFRYNKGHETFDREWFAQTLLISKDPIDTSSENIDESLFFQPNELQALNNQVPFARRFEKSYHHFKLIEIVSEKEVKEVASFIYPYWKGQLQYLYFSENAEYMYERLFFERAQIYKRVQKSNNNSSECSWQLVKRLTNLPQEFTNGTQYPFYMSPDFQKYLDIEQQKEEFVIRDVISQQVIYTIPKWLMSYQEEGLKPIVNRFKWRSKNEIQIINKEGVEGVFSIIEGQYPNQIMFHAIPIYQSDWCYDNHYYYDKPPVENLDILERLKRKYQAYKARRLMENESDPLKIYPDLFTVDYNYRKENDQEMFDRHVIDQSFTFLHWNLVEQLASGKLQIEQINDEQLKCLIYNIFPGGQTLLHMLEGEIIEKLFQKCHIFNPQQKKLNVRLHLPYVQNFNGITPMDILNEKSDILRMDKMLYNLTPYGQDHHSREIKHLFSIFIRNRLPSLNDYLTSRVIQSSYLKTIDKAGINDDGLIVEGVSPASYWLSHAEDPERNQLLTLGEREVRVEFIDIACLHCYDNKESQNFFDALSNCDDMTVFEQVAVQKIINYKWALTKEYTIKRLMYPYLAFMSTYLLYMNWFYLIRNEPGYNILNYGFIGVLGFFCQYFFVLEMKQLQNEGLSYLYSMWNYLDLIPPIALSIFLPLEFFGAFNYQADVEIYMARQRMANLIGDGTNPIVVEDPTVGIRTLEGVLQAVLSLILWLKLLYFLRIYKSFGYYIRLIVDVIVDMKYFLSLLLLTFIAFGDSFRQISSSNADGEDFIGGTILTAIAYIYRMVLGDFDTNAFGSVAVGYVWILFFLCTLFNMIIMMNLLIAIISESFAEVNSVSEQASFREQADIIAENTYLIPTDRQQEYCAPHKYLLCATDLQQESEGALQFEDQLQIVIKGLSAQTDSTEAKLTAQVAQLHSSSLQEIDSQAELMRQTNQQMVETIEAMNEKFHGMSRSKNTR